MPIYCHYFAIIMIYLTLKVFGILKGPAYLDFALIFSVGYFSGDLKREVRWLRTDMVKTSDKVSKIEFDIEALKSKSASR